VSYAAAAIFLDATLAATAASESPCELMAVFLEIDLIGCRPNEV
jgi:hypothetical protein